MTSLTPDERGWYHIKRSLNATEVGTLQELGHIEKLSVTELPLVTVKLAKTLLKLRSLGQLWLWCDVTRSAMCQIIQIPRLRILDVLSIRRPGHLAFFERAENLEKFSANFYVTEPDILEIAKCPSLKEVGIQNSELTHTALDVLLSLPHLQKLDLESTPFNDQMAKLISRSTVLTSLDIGATKISRQGLQHLVTMKQLRSLDLWATALSERDLELLIELPALEYLSIGNYEHLPSLDAIKVVDIVLSIPNLRRVWLDGIRVEPMQLATLKAKLESVRVTSPDTAA
jgi:hypothetical protein